jgi:hypothetical protein
MWSMAKYLLQAALLGIAVLAGAPAIAPTAARPAPPGDAAPANCTDVQVGSAQSYDCINAQLGTLARGNQRFSSDLDAPITASSPSNVVGTFNESATRSRLGPNFGKSATPYRPSAAPPTTIGTPR